MNETATQAVVPLDDVMLAMDVVDTLRHRQDLALRELDEGAREEQLIKKLREIYQQQGIAVPDHILKQGVEALKQSRFAYTPPGPGVGRFMARLYVSRGRWGRWVGGGVLILLLAFMGTQFVYQPIIAAQQEAARVELREGLPQQMQALYQSIYEETKVQSATETAGVLLDRGKLAAAEGDRARAEAALSALIGLRDKLRQEYVLRVVNQPNEQSGFWTFPEVNTDATNYYVVVEALGADNEPLSLPILNEETGETETVTKWGLRVPSTVYNAVTADKRDDGIIQRNVLGRKEYGYLDVEYVVPVLGGAVTRW